MFNKLIRILVAIAIVFGILFAAYKLLPLNLTGGVRQWIQETFDGDTKKVADAARQSYVATYDPTTKRTVASKVTYKDLFEKNCNSVSWYVKSKTATGGVVEVNGYKVTIQVDDPVTPNNSKTWTEAHIKAELTMTEEGGVYKLTAVNVWINDEKQDDTYTSMILDDLLSKVNP